MSVIDVTTNVWGDAIVLSGAQLVSCVSGTVRVTTNLVDPVDDMDGVFLAQPNDSIDFADGQSIRFRKIGDGEARVSFTAVG